MNTKALIIAPITAFVLSMGGAGLATASSSDSTTAAPNVPGTMQDDSTFGPGRMMGQGQGMGQRQGMMGPGQGMMGSGQGRGQGRATGQGQGRSMGQGQGWGMMGQDQGMGQGWGRGMGHGMMGHGMMGMMGNCPMMDMEGGLDQKAMMQMRGEMMRAMGEIMIKYADKLESPESSQESD